MRNLKIYFEILDKPDFYQFLFPIIAKNIEIRKTVDLNLIKILLEYYRDILFQSYTMTLQYQQSIEFIAEILRKAKIEILKASKFPNCKYS